MNVLYLNLFGLISLRKKERIVIRALIHDAVVKIHFELRVVRSNVLYHERGFFKVVELQIVRENSILLSLMISDIRSYFKAWESHLMGFQQGRYLDHLSFEVNMNVLGAVNLACLGHTLVPKTEE